MKSHNNRVVLDKRLLHTACGILAERDKDFFKIISQFGPPPLWQRQKGFATLIYIILEQQVSLASAKAAFEKLNTICPLLNPQNFLKLNDRELKSAGFSRQEAEYARGVALAISTGEFNIEQLEKMDDEQVRNELIRLKGIGPWTADIYLLMVLCRPNIWPTGDLALLSALKEIKNLNEIPDKKTFEAFGELWKPWRAVAARILWHYYLNQRSNRN